MTKNINIQNKKETLFELQRLKEKQYDYDVKFTNVHLREINALVNMNLFSKNDLFVESNTLWDLMQPLGNSRKHHFHELSPEDILESLNSITTPYCVLKNDKGRIEIISPTAGGASPSGRALMIVHSDRRAEASGALMKLCFSPCDRLPNANVHCYCWKYWCRQDDANQDVSQVLRMGATL